MRSWHSYQALLLLHQVCLFLFKSKHIHRLGFGAGRCDMLGGGAKAGLVRSFRQALRVGKRQGLRRLGEVEAE